uniref:RRM domain-containing protein n=1 Tax=Anopheles epiroticus TaxID=199890 RepID=A0A182PS59_9DIPT
MSEDDRILWCGNLSENVTEDMLYELFLQAGPLENVKIPRDGDRRQRNYAFITFVHACSVEYAINIFDGTVLFQRPLTLHRKNRNGPNPAASPQVNFNYPVGGSTNSSSSNHLRVSSDDFPQPVQQSQAVDDNAFLSVNNFMDQFPGLYSAFANPQNMRLTPEMIAQLGQQMLGADLPPLGDEQSSLQTKLHRNERSHYHDRHNKKPYSREDRYGHKNNRSESNSSSRHSKYDNVNRRNSNEHDHHRNNRRRR